MTYDQSCQYMMARAEELVPHVKAIIQDLQAMGKTEHEINVEVCFSLIHEGWRMREMQTGVDLSA